MTESLWLQKKPVKSGRRVAFRAKRGGVCIFKLPEPLHSADFLTFSRFTSKAIEFSAGTLTFSAVFASIFCRHFYIFCRKSPHFCRLDYIFCRHAYIFCRKAYISAAFFSIFCRFDIHFWSAFKTAGNLTFFKRRIRYRPTQSGSMSSVESLIEPFRDVVMNDASLIENVAQILMEKNPNLYDESVYVAALEALVGNDISTPASEPIKKDYPKMVRPKFDSSRFSALSRRKRERAMTIISQIDAIVQRNPQGLTKTSILMFLRKDNSHWRGEITEWLDYMVRDGVIQSNGRRYYPFNIIMRSRERNLHRTIYEGLSNGSKNLTRIYIDSKCNGGRSRSYVRDALNDLMNEGYIILEGRQYRWKP